MAAIPDVVKRVVEQLFRRGSINAQGEMSTMMYIVLAKITLDQIRNAELVITINEGVDNSSKAARNCQYNWDERVL